MIYILTTLVVLAIISLWNQPVYRRYQVTSEKIDKPVTLVQLSDLHGSIYGKDQKRLIRKIKAADPDIIVMTGDMVDDVVDEAGAYTLMEALKDYPLYYVSGNHEGWHPNTEKVFETIENMGVTCYFNDSEVIEVNGNLINIGGILDPAGTGNRRHSFGDRFKKDGNDHYNVLSVDEEIRVSGLVDLDSNNFTLLLSHRPEYMDTYKTFGLDLVLSGHAHGGQVRIPFLINGLYAPNQGTFPKYAGGLYEEDGLHLIVSRGLSLNWLLPRVFNPPEVVVITLESGN